ncbi:MAG: hypothetical protein PF450_02775 [Bacteroidales bacterium]|jgi:hypothetical protein|nr:hypothetical protein [Bacteroidales bacterium]
MNTNFVKSFLVIALLNVLSFYSSSTLAQHQISKATRPTPKLEFLGWDYAKNGYTLNPGEDLTLLFQNNTNKSENMSIWWTLETYEGDSLLSGDSELSVKAGAISRVDVDLPENLEDGAYMIQYRLDAIEWEGTHPFYFDYRVPVPNENLDLNILAFIETMDCEAWARMMLGPLADFANVTADWPEDPNSIDAVLVVAEALDFFNPKLAKLENYTREGGTLIVFGKTAPALINLLPIRGSEKISKNEKPLSLLPQEIGPWQDFSPTSDFLHYPIRVLPKEGADILATWSDGSPAVVSGSYGMGKVIYVGAGS